MKKDLALVNDAQKAVNLAIDPIRRLYTGADNPLLAEMIYSMGMIETLADMDLKLKRIITCLEATK